MASPTTPSRPRESALEDRPVQDRSSFPFATAREHDALKQLTTVLTRHLGTLTSTISGYADLLVDSPDAQEQREIAMNVLEASARIDDLLTDLRHYSRPLEPSLRPVAVSEVVHGAIDLLDEADQGRVRQKVEPEAAREIKADPRLLRQALFNLLQNALEATDPPETVLIRAALAQESEEPSPTVDFEVWNDGEIGLDDPSDAFRPFFTLRPQRLGLGLPLATEIAEQHGGGVQLTATSGAEGGTCFTLRI